LHLAGEWVVGGVEAKCFAYAFVLLALRDMIDGRWNRVWFLLGVATAFHPLVGGWSGLVCAAIWFFDDRRRLSFRMMLPGLLCGGLVALLGILPALMLTWDEPPDLVAEANRIYVFDRLSHHLAPLALPMAELARRLGGHAALLLAFVALVLAMRPSNKTTNQLNSRSAEQAAPPAPLTRIAQFAFGAVLLAAIGFAIELVLWHQPFLAAKLLRYYWFRLTDFALPAAAALYATAFIANGFQHGRKGAPLALAAALLFTGWNIANSTRDRVLNPVPPADAKLRDWAAWIDACDWVSANTPAEAMFLTPRLNLTFKWRAGRPEVANRKDVPQDADSIVQWHARIRDVYYATIEGVEEPLDSLGILGAERVRELALKYDADYVLMDRGQLLSLPLAYKNEEYAIYRINRDNHRGPANGD
jgi:hypothetical protein